MSTSAPGHAGTRPRCLDQDRLGAFAGQVAAALTGGATAAMIVVGDRLGLYAALGASGPLTAAGLAGTTDTAERYVREWLAQQASVGFVEYDAGAGTFSLPPEHAAVLATDDSPVALAGCALLISGMHRRIDEIVAAFRTGHGVPWAEQDTATFESTERFWQVSYRTSLVSEWVPALDGVQARLEAGGNVADVGCGHGAALILLAEAFPRSRFIGFDVHEPSILTARRRAAEAGVSDRVRFEVSHCHGYPGHDYDLVTFFDSFHDLGDPVGAAAHARSALAPGGRLMLVEPLAADDLATNIDTVPGAGLNYAASTFLCTPNSLSQPVGLALGAQAGEARLREVLLQAGYDWVRRVGQNQFSMVLEAGSRQVRA